MVFLKIYWKSFYVQTNMDGKVTEFAEHGHYQQPHKCDYNYTISRHIWNTGLCKSTIRHIWEANLFEYLSVSRRFIFRAFFDIAVANALNSDLQEKQVKNKN